MHWEKYTLFRSVVESCCDWSVNLDIHFGDDKSKSILFGKKKKHEQNKVSLDMSLYTLAKHAVIYLEWKSIRRIKFLHWKNRFSSQPFCRLLWKTLIQPHFNWLWSSWYQYFKQKIKVKIITTTPKQMHTILLQLE